MKCGQQCGAGITQTSQARSVVSKALAAWICGLLSRKRTTVSHESNMSDGHVNGDVIDDYSTSVDGE